VTVTVEAPREFTLALRRPAWAGEGFAVTVNGEVIANVAEPGNYVEIKRTWQSDDKVKLTLPKKLHLEPLPDNPQRVAVMWGPLVLAGDLGPGRERGRRGGGRGNREQPSAPVLVAAEKPVEEWVRPSSEDDGSFRTNGVGRDRDVNLTPFYRLHRRLYAAYWDLFTPSQWAQREQEIAAERERLRRLEQATVAFFQPGQMQAERDVNFQGSEDNTFPIREAGRAGRAGRDWFSFDLPVDSGKPLALVVTYYSGRRPREPKFNILVDGEPIAKDETVKRDSPARFYDVEYSIPPTAIDGKEKVTVRFETTEGYSIGPVFGIRMIRADRER
jgi:hypothetical protein